jgi:IS5 family transposase
MKGHIGTDRRGIVHSLTTTAANVHDSTQISRLLHGHERELFGDQAYGNEAHRRSRKSWQIRALADSDASFPMTFAAFFISHPARTIACAELP